MSIHIPLVVQAVMEDYALPWDGTHGVRHWARVLTNGEKLAAITGADLRVVRLFAVLHDSRRESETTDPEHGPRAAEFAAELRGSIFELEDDAFALLHRACAGHTHERNHPNVTIATCWDSDRLDLGRVGVLPHPSRLCTDAGRTREMIFWANGRASFDFEPDFVAEEWKIDLP